MCGFARRNRNMCGFGMAIASPPLSMLTSATKACKCLSNGTYSTRLLLTLASLSMATWYFAMRGSTSAKNIGT